MPASNRSRSSNRRNGRVSLAEEINETGPLRKKSRPRKRKLGAEEADDDNTNHYVDSRASRKILKIGQELQDEDNAETAAKSPNPAFTFESRFPENEESEEDIDERNYEDDAAWGSGEDEAAAEADPKDLDIFDKLNPSRQPDLVTRPPDSNAEDEGGGTNLADLILEKIAAQEANGEERAAVQGGGPEEEAIELPPKVVEVYTKIGGLLSRHRSGKLPKPFKILPTLPAPQCFTLLSITRPESWTPNACEDAMRIFISSPPEYAETFLLEVMLDRVRSEIHETKKLNVHLYDALKKSLYKPAAFFKGFLFPLVGSGTCTLREAHIISSILVRTSVPVLHSAAALLRLTELAAELTGARDVEAAGAANVFLKVLIDKKYALPYRVVDGLVFHFLRYRGVHFDTQDGEENVASAQGRGKNGGKLPVIWHQCLLAFAQRYRNDITEDQREALLDLLIAKGHKDIGPEVRRELLAGRGRGVPLEPEVRPDGDDTMIMD